MKIQILSWMDSGDATLMYVWRLYDDNAKLLAISFYHAKKKKILDDAKRITAMTEADIIDCT